MAEYSILNYREYIIKYVYRKTTNAHGAQGGCAFVVCHGQDTAFGVGVKVFTFVEEDITEEVQQNLFEIGKRKVFEMIDRSEFVKGKYYCYEWKVENQQSLLDKLDCNTPRWGMIPLIEHECSDTL